MPRTIAVEVYQFSELSDAAKEKAREWYRECEAQDFAPCYEQYDTAAKLLGIEIDDTGRKQYGVISIPDIRYSGFCSQGDGASFVGSFTPKHSSIDIREEFPTDEKLHAIADALTAFHCRYILNHGTRDWSAKITQSGNYYHKFTMSAEVYDADGNELDAELCDEFLEIMRDFAQWIYDGLEAEYDYRMSDEAVDEAMEANEYEFDEDGDRI